MTRGFEKQRLMRDVAPCITKTVSGGVLRHGFTNVFIFEVIHHFIAMGTVNETH